MVITQFAVTTETDFGVDTPVTAEVDEPLLPDVPVELVPPVPAVVEPPPHPASRMTSAAVHARYDQVLDDIQHSSFVLEAAQQCAH
jgi:hypothetical protein